jgi:hypothetical protein
MTSTYAFATQSDESIELEQRPGPNTSIRILRVVEVAARQDNQVCLVRRAAINWSGVARCPADGAIQRQNKTHQEAYTMESLSAIPVMFVSFSC